MAYTQRVGQEHEFQDLGSGDFHIVNVDTGITVMTLTEDLAILDQQGKQIGQMRNSETYARVIQNDLGLPTPVFYHNECEDSGDATVDAIIAYFKAYINYHHRSA